MTYNAENRHSGEHATADALQTDREASERVALVLGGSGGIGRAVALRLAHDRVAVAVHYSGNEIGALDIVKEIITSGGRALAVSGDVADDRDVAGAFTAVEAEFGGVDVVVNTAGIMTLAPIAELSLDDFDRMHRTNVRGTFVVSQQAARRVRAGGAIINFSTSVTRTQFPKYGAYWASKGAVESLTLTLARELRGRDVTGSMRWLRGRRQPASFLMARTTRRSNGSRRRLRSSDSGSLRTLLRLWHFWRALRGG